MKPKLIVEQKITAFVNRYTIFEVEANGAKGGLVAFVEQKRIALKEKITFFKDDTKQQVLFTLRAEKVLDVHGRYLVEDADGKLIGIFKKAFKQSLINSTWHILDKDEQPQVEIKESSTALAIFRRFSGFIPVIGGLLDLLVAFLRYHFVFIEVSNGQEAGKYQKTTLFRDHYLLSLTDEVYSKTDWRLLAALSVALDALQSR